MYARIALVICAIVIGPDNAPAYDQCVRAAIEGDYAVEICEPLIPGYIDPFDVRSGPVSAVLDDGSVTYRPALAVDIADSCEDESFSVDCIQSVINAH